MIIIILFRIGIMDVQGRVTNRAGLVTLTDDPITDCSSSFAKGIFIFEINLRNKIMKFRKVQLLMGHPVDLYTVIYSLFKGMQNVLN